MTEAAIERVDAVIVGAGAAGSLMAAKLAQAGKTVMVLEAGPARTLDHLVSAQTWARRLKWSGPPVIESGANPIGHVFNAGFGVGGSMLHHYGVWPRLHGEDFALQSRYDRGLDWPIDYDDLRPYYDRVQDEVGLSGDAEAEIWRPAGAPYPMPPVPLLAQGEVLAKGFDALGMHTAPLPLAVNSVEYKGRAACIWDGWCDAGCPIGALANPLVVYLPQAKTAGAVVKANAAVTRVLTNPAGDRAVGVEYRDANGTRHVQHADLVVLAAFTVENARLLLASATARHANGLANSSGLVGHYVMTHPAVAIYGLFDDETTPYLGATGGQLINQDGYDKTRADKPFGSYQWMIAQALKPNDLLGFGTGRPDIFGPALNDFMRRAAHHVATMTGVGEDFPMVENRIALSDRKDAFGMPLAAVHHDSSPQSLAIVRHMIAEGTRIFTAAGAKDVWNGPQAPMHLMGGTVMGVDAANSVTNSYGQCHDIGNLVIAGPGLFPTSGAVNPTFTLHATTLRAAEHLIAHWPA